MPCQVVNECAALRLRVGVAHRPGAAHHVEGGEASVLHADAREVERAGADAAELERVGALSCHHAGDAVARSQRENVAGATLRQIDRRLAIAGDDGAGIENADGGRRAQDLDASIGGRDRAGIADGAGEG